MLNSCHLYRLKNKTKIGKSGLNRWQKRTQRWGKLVNWRHFLLIWKQRNSWMTQAALDKRQRKAWAEKGSRENPEALAEWSFVSHPLPQWHRAQSNSLHSWPCISLASRDLLSLPQLNFHPHIINDCFVHRSIMCLFIKSPFAPLKIPLLSSLWHLRKG